MSFSIYIASLNWAHSSQIACHSLPSVGSTNDWAKEDAFRSGASDFEFFIADHQSSGRGRGQNTWSGASPGTMLLSSWSFTMSAAPQPVLAPALGLAVFRALQTSWPDLALSLKAPNDIYLGDKKLAGLLLESLQQGEKTRLILGLGLNVFSKPDLATATSLAEHLPLGRISELGWGLFLDRLWLELVSSFRETRTELSENQQEALRFALNRNPHQKIPLEKLAADGSLIHSGGSKTPWTSL